MFDFQLGLIRPESYGKWYYDENKMPTSFKEYAVTITGMKHNVLYGDLYHCHQNAWGASIPIAFIQIVEKEDHYNLHRWIREASSTLARKKHNPYKGHPSLADGIILAEMWLDETQTAT